MPELILFAVIAAAALLLQSTIGFAGALLAIPLLTLFMSPRDAVPSYALLTLVVNVMVLVEARSHVDWRRVAKFLAGAVVGVAVGSHALASLPGAWLAMVINVFTIGFGVLFLLGVRLPLPDNLPVNLAVGAASGLLGGATAQSGPPVVLFGLSQGWTKDRFRATLLGYFVCLSVMTSGAFAVRGLIQTDELVRLAAAAVPALAAAHVGILLKRGITERHFRRTVLVVVIAVSLLGVANQLWRS